MKNKKGTSRAVGMFIGAVVCFFLFQQTAKIAPGAFDRVVACVAFPFLQIQSSVVDPVVCWWSEWQRKSAIDGAYQQLLQERDDLRAQVLEMQATKKFSEETEEIRGFKDQYHHFGAVLVRVLLRQVGTEGNFFLVDGGTSKGIHKDTAVVYKNYLVGKVSEVFPYYSKVLLISDPSCKVAAYCDATDTQGIYQGGGQQGALTHVGHLSEVRDGDTVFSSGEGVIFPRGFGIGIISSFVKNEGDMQYTIAVTPFLDFSTICYCYVLEKEQIQNVSANVSSYKASV